MKYKPEFPVTLTDEQLETDLRTARNMGKVRLGAHGLFISRFSGGTFLPYSEVRLAYLRQEEVNARLCCGRANFDQFFLMLKGSDDVLRKHPIKDMASGKAVLEYIEQKNPNCIIGYRPTP